MTGKTISNSRGAYPPQSAKARRVRPNTERVRRAAHYDAPSLSDLLTFGALLIILSALAFAYSVS